MSTIPFTGFTPSVDPTTAGAVLDCSQLVPTLRGMKAAPAPYTSGVAAFPTSVLGAAACELLTGAYRVVVGTSTHMYEVNDTTYADVSAYAYNGGDNRWRFAQFGNATLATNGVDPIQESISAGTFNNVGSPISSVAVTAAGSGYTSVPTATVTSATGYDAAVNVALAPTSVASISTTNSGSGYVMPTIGVTAPPTGGTYPIIYPILTAGSVSGFNIVSGGSGYTSVPAISVSSPTSGTTATAVTTLTSGVITAVTLVGAGSGYNSAPTVTLSAPVGTTATATATLSSDGVSAATIVLTGAGYTSVPAVVFSSPASGTTATGTAIFVGGTITGITVTSAGSGYSTAPSVTLDAPVGVTATATAVVASGVIIGYSITSIGSGYVAAPTVTITATNGGTGAAAVPFMYAGHLIALIAGGGGSGYTNPTVAIDAPTATTGTLKNATAVASLYQGYVSSIALKDGGSGYTVVPNVSIASPSSGTRALATAVLTPTTIGTITVTAQGSGYSTAPTIVFAGGGGTGAAATVSMQWAPAAYIIEVTQGFVFSFDTTSDDLGHRPNGWQCSAIYNQQDWVAASATQSAYGVIIDTPGKITAGRALGTNIVAYKSDSMYYGTYQGPPVIWAFNQISPIVGTPSQECVVPIGTKHVFLGTDAQVYQYDGSTVTPIGDEVKDWLYDTWSSEFRDRVESYHDKENSLIFWYFCSISAQTALPDTCLVFNYRTGKFGRADQSVEAATTIISGQIDWDDLGSLPGVTTWDTLPAIPYNSSFWSNSSAQPAIVDSTHTLMSLSGTPAASSLTTGWFGDDRAYFYLQGVVPRFSLQPTACTGTAQSVSSLGATPKAQVLGDMLDGELAADFSARYAKLKLNFTGSHEILGAIPRVLDAGVQ